MKHRFQLEVTVDKDSTTVSIGAVADADPNMLAIAVSHMMVFVASTCDQGFEEGLEALVSDAKVAQIQHLAPQRSH
jgi:hypothetical protein